MSKLVMIGAGGHCKSVLESARSMRQFDEIVITDKIIPAGSEIHGCKIVGNDEKLIELRQNGFDNAFVAVGFIESSELRDSLILLARKLGFVFPVIIDYSAIISPFVKIGEGSFIGKRAVLNSDTTVGNHCIINTGAIIEHDCCIGDNCHISVGTVVCGGTNVGCNTFIGAGSTVIQGLTIGNNSVIGAGSLVLNSKNDNFKGYGIIS